MYDQIREDTLYLMFYAGVTVLNLIACCYLLFRRSNAIAPNVTSSVRLRRWTAGFLGASTLSHLWYMPLIYLTASEDIMMLYLVCTLLDILTVFPLAIAVLFTMLQDRRRPHWPIGVMMAPLAAGMMVCIATRSDAILPVLYAYYLLLIISIIIYMVRATRQYGCWLRDNYADLEHKEVWQSFVVLAVILLFFGIYTLDPHGLAFKYVTQVNSIILVCYLLWRVETLSDLSEIPRTSETPRSSDKNDDFTPLLQKYCIDTQLYLQHGLTVAELARAIGTNRFYLSQYFSQRGITYNAYINGLRIDHFKRLYHEAVTAEQSFTAQQLALECGFHNYRTFSNAFKQQTGQTVTAWMKAASQ